MIPREIFGLISETQYWHGLCWLHSSPFPCLEYYFIQWIPFFFPPFEDKFMVFNTIWC